MVVAGETGRLVLPECTLTASKGPALAVLEKGRGELVGCNFAHRKATPKPGDKLDVHGNRQGGVRVLKDSTADSHGRENSTVRRPLATARN